MRKKILALFLVASMACSVAACGEKKQEQGKDNGTGQESINQENTEQDNIDDSKEPTSEDTQELDENAKPYLGVWTSARGQILAFFEDGTCYLNGDNKHTFQMDGKTCVIDEFNIAEFTDETGECLYIDFPELGMERKYYRGTEKSVEEQKNANSDITWMMGEWKDDTTQGSHLDVQIVIREDGTCDLTLGGNVISANWEKGITAQDEYSGITIYVDGEPQYYFAGIPTLKIGYYADELPVDDLSFEKFLK